MHSTDESKATKAAEEVAGHENRWSGIESRPAVLTWMTGTNVALTVAVLFKLFHSLLADHIIG